MRLLVICLGFYFKGWMYSMLVGRRDTYSAWADTSDDGEGFSGHIDDIEFPLKEERRYSFGMFMEKEG